ncbi:hypothetical protein ACFXO9_37935 [Nocardia tengchongensis]|uniref:hypothetical protein n=1 Tax=Nocardia tengchongensis TaxID=2055889 RepID=UPI00367A2660
MDQVFGEVPAGLITAEMRQLIGEILTRYGSVDAFCARLHRLLDDPTDQIPALAAQTPPRGRHRLRAL